MTRVHARASSVALLASVVLIGVAGPAHGDPGRLGSPEVVDGTLRVPFSVELLPEDVALDPATVRVEVDGRPLPASAVLTSRAGTVGPRSAVLVVDVSGSMRGDRLAQAKSAAHAFLDAVPADVEVGLVTFARDVTVTAPSLDRDALRTTVAGLQAAGTTLLNDGVIAAAHAVGPVGERTLVLLSDGAHEGSPTTTEQAATALRASGATLSAVNVGGDVAAAQQLTALADAGRGQVADVVDGTALQEAFRTAARRFSEQLSVSVALPADLSGRDVAVAVAVSAEQQVFEASTSVALPDFALAGPPRSATVLPAAGAGTLLKVGSAATFVALLVLSLLLFGPGRGRADKARATRQLLEAYTLGARDGGTPAPTRMVDGSPVARALLAVAGRWAASRGRTENLHRRLDQAAVALTPAEWVLLQVGAALAGGLSLALAAGGGLLGLLLGAGLGAAAPGLWLRHRAATRRAAFMDALPDALQLVASGLSSGYSLAQALDAVVQDGMQPVAAEMGRALAEARLGVSLEDALENVARRMASEDMDWIVMAVRVQREVGGNLAEVLNTVFETMRERARIRREVRTLSAEGRMSAWVLIALPIFMAGFQLLFRRDYMRPLYTEPAGIVMLALTVVSVVIGGLWTSKLVKVEV